MDLPYLQPVLAVVANLGVQLVEPFYANTISTISTHSSLKKFFISLYESMEDNLKKDFFTFANPVFRGVDWELFEGVKASYKEEVLCVVSRVANEHKEEVLKPGEGMLPYLRTVLARQRRDYGIDEERFPSQYPVESQAANIDQTPEHNLAADRLQDQEDTQPSSSVSKAQLQGIQGGGEEEEGVGDLLEQVHEGEDEQGVR